MERIDPRYLLIQVAEILDGLKIPYLVSGGIAVLVWGRPRFTADIDIVVELTEKDISNLAQKLQGLGEAGYIDESAMAEALKHKGEFNFIDGETGIKVDFWILGNDPFDKLRLKRRIPRVVHGKMVYFVSPEDLILIKLKWYSESESSRQLEDVESVLKISGPKLDKKYLNTWAKKLGVAGILKDLYKKCYGK